jgi:hypothetical protein
LESLLRRPLQCLQFFLGRIKRMVTGFAQVKMKKRLELLH